MSNIEVSTKEKIKKCALALFAEKGFYGTTMNEIADGVGIKKPSIYAHFSGKEDLFFAIYEELAFEYKSLMERLLEESVEMDIDKRLFYLFEKYVSYYINNREIQLFWNQLTWFSPPELKEAIGPHIMSYEEDIQTKMIEMFNDGMRKGIIREDNPSKMMMSFRAMREGLLNWMLIVPELKQEWIKEFWKDFWTGIKKPC